MTVNTQNFDIANGRLVKYSGFDAVVKIPSGVTSIGEDAFGGAWSVGEIATAPSRDVRILPR